MDWWEGRLIGANISAASHALLHAFFKGWSAILLLIVFWKFIRIVNAATNDLDWADAISSRGVDGKQHLDVSKIGLCWMVIQAVWLPAVYAYSEKLDGMGLAAVMAASGATLGGVGAFIARLRSQQGKVEQVHTEEDALGKVTDKTTLTPPVAPASLDAAHPPKGSDA